MAVDVTQLREEYTHDTLEEADLTAEPMALFNRWLEEATQRGVPEPNAMTLATVDAEGQPNARVVLLKGLDDGGLAFYTNYHSAKGRELAAQPVGALVFWWALLQRQVRFQGRVEQLSREASKAYFHSRPRGSQLGAVASHQSCVVAGREPLEARYRQLETRHGDGEIPLPDHWGGYRLVPWSVEFWQGRPSRLHDRLRYRQPSPGAPWLVERLEP
ncbi:MAG: pyridoxamine 5'-phosphate oxidase [Candidatus Competibacterales bacterium]